MWTGTFERFINISQTSDKDRSELSFRLLSIGVNEKFQGKGIAIQLIINLNKHSKIKTYINMDYLCILIILKRSNSTKKIV